MKPFEEIRKLSRDEFEAERMSWSWADCLKYLIRVGARNPEVSYVLSVQNSTLIFVPYILPGDIVRLLSDTEIRCPMTVESIAITSQDAKLMYCTDEERTVLCIWADVNGIVHRKKFYEDVLEKINSQK